MNVRSRKTYAAVVALLLIGATAWGLMIFIPPEDDINLPEEFTVASLKDQTAEPGQIGQTMRQLSERDDLTDEQRQQVRRNMREVFQSMMNERVNEYFAAAAADKNAVLDRHIDDMQRRMQRWREMRERRLEQENNGDENERDEERRQRWRDRMNSQTPEQRKTRSESRSPDQTAKRMTYFAAIRKRMEQRGISMPWGRSGGGHRGGA